jgi:hypothetical protein
MVFTRNALASGPGMAGISIAFTPTWRKVKVGKEFDGKKWKTLGGGKLKKGAVTRPGL